MSLFERIKNIRRNNLQEEKMKFPGGTGDIGFTAPKRQEKVQKRLTRADKLGTPDPFDPDYDKKVKKVDKRTKTGKAFQTPKKSDLKKLSKKPGGYSAPKGEFGPGITKGQANVKGMERRSFKITKPSDVKLPQTFTDFSKKLRRLKSDIQDVKDKDIATMRTGKSSSKVKVSGANNLTRQDVGMAPPNTPKRTKPQKGVSAIETTKKFDKIRAEKAIKKQQSKLSKAAKDITQQRDDAIVKREKLRSVKGVKDTKTIRATNRQVKELDKLAKQTQKAASGVGNPNAPVKYNKMTQGADFIKKNRKSNTKLVTKSASKNPIKKTKVPKEKVKLPKFGTGARKYATQRGADTAFGKSTVGKLAKKVGFKPSYGLRKVATTAVKKGGLPAVVGLGLLSSPYARTAIKTALVGGGLSAFKSKKEPVAKLDKEKKIGKTVKFSLSPKQKA